MFSLKSLTAILAVGVLSATAAPASNGVDAAVIAARQNRFPQVYICTDKNYGGQCDAVETGPGVCFNVPPHWNDVISSLRNLRQEYHCVWWNGHNCAADWMANQEDSNLGDGNGWLDDKISSWRCS